MLIAFSNTTYLTNVYKQHRSNTVLSLHCTAETQAMNLFETVLTDRPCPLPALEMQGSTLTYTDMDGRVLTLLTSRDQGAVVINVILTSHI